MFIYQKSGDNIQVLNFKEPESDKIICVKFTHSNKNSSGNHYYAIICKRHFQGNGLQMLTEVATDLLKKANNLLQKGSTADASKIPVHKEKTPSVSTNKATDDEMPIKKEHKDISSMSDNDSDVHIIGYDKPQTTPTYSGTTEAYIVTDETYVSTDLELRKKFNMFEQLSFSTPTSAAAIYIEFGKYK